MCGGPVRSVGQGGLGVTTQTPMFWFPSTPCGDVLLGCVGALSMECHCNDVSPRFSILLFTLSLSFSLPV